MSSNFGFLGKNQDKFVLDKLKKDFRLFAIRHLQV